MAERIIKAGDRILRRLDPADDVPVLARGGQQDAPHIHREYARCLALGVRDRPLDRQTQPAAETPHVGQILGFFAVNQRRQLVRQDVLRGVEPDQDRMIPDGSDAARHVIDHLDLERRAVGIDDDAHATLLAQQHIDLPRTV